MAKAVMMPWGALRPSREPFLSYPGAKIVEVDEDGRVTWDVSEPVGKPVGKKKRAARKKAAPPSESVDNSDLGDLDGLDDL